MKKITIKDVAKHANVSVAVVSKALNGYTDVSEKTRKHVQKVAEELNYRPNFIAKQLSQKESKSVGLLFFHFESSRMKDNHIYEVMSGAYQKALELGYELIIFTTDKVSEESRSYVEFCKERKLAGVLMAGIRTTDHFLEEIITSNYPCVILDGKISGEKLANVTIDDCAAARDAVEFLIKKGHTKIGMINGRESAAVSMERLMGYKAALENAGLSVEQSLIRDGDFSEEVAYHLADQFIHANPDMTAVFCASDLMAIGFMRRCIELGIHIPNDLSIIGFDDIYLSEYVTPKLSTIHQSMNKKAAVGMETLIKIVKNEQFVKDIILEHELIDRETIRR